MLIPTPHRRGSEHASAMIAAIAIMVIGAFIIVAVMVNGMSSSGNARASTNRASAEQLARDAGTTLAAIYSTMDSGEFDNFVPSVQVMTRHVNSIGATLESNPAAIGPVDGSIPGGRQRSVCRALEDGRYGCWQLFAVKAPVWGTTKAGAVSVYVRAWTRVSASPSSRLSDPIMYRVDLRPTWMSDYQMVVDGKMLFAPGATINGRVHSNGRASSFFDQLEHPAVTSQVMVGFGGAAFCTSAARISTTEGNVDTSTSPSCNNKKYMNTKREVNLLRAQAMARQLRAVYGLPHPNLQMASFNNTTAPVTVQLSGNTVTANGTSLTAGTSATNNGAVVLATGDINIRGTLGPNARAMVVAMSQNGTNSLTSGSAPSVTITNTGAFGAANAPGSSLGIVAQGDVIVPSRPGGGCSITPRGAFTAMSGMLSIDRKVRVPLQVDTGGGYHCAGSAQIMGSVAAHYSGVLSQPANDAGFDTRTYSYLNALFDNPPPMYLTAFDWQVYKFAPADLSCFNASGQLNTSPASGCVA
jgi:hypothetical protein